MILAGGGGGAARASPLATNPAATIIHLIVAPKQNRIGLDPLIIDTARPRNSAEGRCLLYAKRCLAIRFRREIYRTEEVYRANQPWGSYFMNNYFETSPFRTSSTALALRRRLGIAINRCILL
jgi:hypothetical protein